MDRLLRYVPHIQEATFFDIQNISDYFWSSDNEYHDLINFNLALPFPFMCTKYALPEKIYSKDKGLTHKPEWKDGEVLTVFQTIPGLDRLLAIHGPQVAKIAQDKIPNSAKWIIEAAVYFARKRQIYADVVYLYALNEFGQIIKNDQGDSAFFIIHTTFDDDVMFHTISYLHVSGMALTFLHCKNVEVVNPPKPTKRLPRKIKFESRYHVLRVNAIGGEKRSQGTGQATGIKQGLSIIRGHFREYGPEYGKGKLFGRLSGRFWVAAHLKGDEQLGVIEKDYKIE